MYSLSKERVYKVKESKVFSRAEINLQENWMLSRKYRFIQRQPSKQLFWPPSLKVYTLTVNYFYSPFYIYFSFLLSWINEACCPQGFHRQKTEEAPADNQVDHSSTVYDLLRSDCLKNSNDNDDFLERLKTRLIRWDMSALCVKNGLSWVEMITFQQLCLNDRV